MKTQIPLRLLALFLTILASALTAYGQVSSAAPLSGTVTDHSGAVLPGAVIVVKNDATGATFNTTTVNNGTFTVPALNPGTYTVTVTMTGFKQAIVNGVKLDASTPASVQISLEVGTTADTVTVQAGGDIVQTQTAAISTTIVGRQITELPLPWRDALTLTLLLPGANTPASENPRRTTINGLPRSAVNIMIDGVNTQEQAFKDNDFLSYISPRVDAIEEVTISTATPGAESSGQGAVQIKFVTRQGSNELHGSLYEYHRDRSLNANYWFNNRDLAPDPHTGKAPRNQVLLNQFGGRVGGPITIPKLFDGRNKAFFFVNLENYYLPNAPSRTRTILNPLTQQGVFQYNVTVGGQTQVRQVDLLALAARNGQLATIDPTVGKLLADIRNTTSQGGVVPLADPNLQQFTFLNKGQEHHIYPTLRLDFNLTSKHHLEYSGNVQQWRRIPDILNNADPAFPGFPVFGTQTSTRFSHSAALRSTLTPTLVNEARVGLTAGTIRFSENITRDTFSGQVANQGGFALGTGLNNGGFAAAIGITNATISSTPSRRNSPFWTFADNVSWQRGPHNLSFGTTFTDINIYTNNHTTVPSITFGVDSNDPASILFNATNGPVNFPGASSADIGRAQNFYAVLTGRVTQIGGNAFLDEETNKYIYIGDNVRRARQRELSFYAQDSWKWKPNLTLNYGLRWQVQFPFTALNDRFTTTTIDALYGVSGPGNIFKPGTLTGKETEFVQFKQGDKPYPTKYQHFAPSFGFAWSPKLGYGWLKPLFGEAGQTVLRGGYSIAFTQPFISFFSDTSNGNPGGSLTTNRNSTLGNLAGGSLGAYPVLLRESSRLGPPTFSDTPVYPIRGAITNSATIFDPELKIPYIQSWTFGLQRQLGRDTALEIRYVGNRGLQGWTTYNLNEVNLIENGFFNEFKLAQANLRANIAAGRGNTFRYSGPGTGTSPLPITLGYFSGATAAQASDPARYTSALFSNATFVNPLALQNPNPQNFATSLYNDAARRANAQAAGLPVNLFLVNPGLQGGASFVGNGGYSSLHSGVVELRRRFSKGLLLQSSYTYAKAYDSARVSLRKPRYNTLNTDVIHHVFRANWIYELPVGRGKALFGNTGGALNKFVGGWEFHGITRIQSGTPFDLGNVRLVGMTRREFQKEISLRFDDANKRVYLLPQDIIDNTVRANNVSATSSTGYGSLGPPAGRYIAPANSSTCTELFNGDCGGTEVIVYSRPFTRFDLSVVKKTRITERLNFELRGEFLNAFNHINFITNSFTQAGGLTSANFGQVTAAYRDIANTNETGGRAVQLVARFNF
ncbi:MAG: TonB-dependent receptor [Acidobacteria bacterium]|nr:TonB-dependent receptor [Acidobacteriota bacterium]